MSAVWALVVLGAGFRELQGDPVSRLVASKELKLELLR